MTAFDDAQLRHLMTVQIFSFKGVYNKARVLPPVPFFSLATRP